jgi:hypothetical protein
VTDIEDYIRVAVVEGSVSVPGPGFDFESLDAPDFEGWLLSRGVPCRLTVARVFSNTFFELQELPENVCGVIRRTSEPRRAMFESSMLYRVGLVR